MDNTTSLKANAQTASSALRQIKTVSGTSRYHRLVCKHQYSEITRPAGEPTVREIKHNRMHYIKTSSGPHVFCRPRRLAPDQLRIVIREFEDMVRAGIARRSNSPWSSPLHLVPKKDSLWRPCGDYRALNNRTVPDRYPVRHIGHFIHNLLGCKIFSKIDLVRVPMCIPLYSCESRWY